MVGDIPINSGAPVVTSSISKIYRLSLSEVHIGVGLRACIHRDECACVFVSVCVCTVFLKKKRYTKHIGTKVSRHILAHDKSKHNEVQSAGEMTRHVTQI